MIKSLQLVLYLIFFIFITSKLIRSQLPDPFTIYVSSRSEKLEIINRLAESTSFAAFGSSHIETSFDPRIFDKEIGKKGFSLKSLNLAISGGNHGEQILMAKKFIDKKTSNKDKKKRPIIMLEITNGVTFPPINRYTSRAINTFDFETTKLSMSLKNIFNEKYLAKSLGQKLVILNSFILNSLNIGMLSSGIFFNKKIDSEKISKYLENDKRGFHENSHIIEPEIADFIDRVETDKFLHINNEKLIESLLENENSKGFFFTFIVAPILENKDDKECIKYPEKIIIDKQNVPIFNFSCKDDYPELFELSNWSDLIHLNTKGARILSTLLADKVSIWLKNKEIN